MRVIYDMRLHRCRSTFDSWLISPVRNRVAELICGLVPLLLISSSELPWRVEASEKTPENFKAADLFRLTNVWSVHLKFTPEQWEAMEPKGGGFPPFGGGRGAFGGRGGGPGGVGFGPG